MQKTNNTKRKHHSLLPWAEGVTTVLLDSHSFLKHQDLWNNRNTDVCMEFGEAGRRGAGKKIKRHPFWPFWKSQRIPRLMADSQLCPGEDKPCPWTQAPVHPPRWSASYHFKPTACQTSRVSKPGTWPRSCQDLPGHNSETLFSLFTGISKIQRYRCESWQIQWGYGNWTILVVCCYFRSMLSIFGN